MDVRIYSDGGLNGQGAYGSFMITAEGDEKNHIVLSLEDHAVTAPEAELCTLMEALDYIKGIEAVVPGRCKWVIALDAKWLYEHLLAVEGERQVAGKFVEDIDLAKTLIGYYDVGISPISGQMMKQILGH